MRHQIQNFQSDVSASLQDDILPLARKLDHMKVQGGLFEVMDAIAQDISHVAGKMAEEYRDRDDFAGGRAYVALINLHHAAAAWEVDGPFEPEVQRCISDSALADGPAPEAYDRMLKAEAKVANQTKLAREAKAKSGEVAQRRAALKRIVGAAPGFKHIKTLAEGDPTIETRVCQLYGLEVFRDMPNDSAERKTLMRDLNSNLPSSPPITHLIG